MKPLSVFYYFLNNKKKIIPIVLSISLGVMFFYFLFLAGKQSDESGSGTYINPYESFSTILAKDNIPLSIIKKIETNGNVMRIIPIKTFPHANITRALGNGSAGIMFLRPGDIRFMMNSMKLKLTEGRIPVSQDEIILHWSIAANKKLKIGDMFKDNNEIQGNYKVVGIFKGSGIIGFVPAEIKGGSIENWLDKHLFIIPQKGKLEDMNRFLNSLPLIDGVSIYTVSKAKDEVSASNKNLHVVMYILIFIVITVLCVTLGNISVMHFYQRRSEFGVLTAIGYTKLDILRRVCIEAALTGAVSYVLGIVLSMICATIFNILFWYPMGESVPMLSPRGLIVTAAIPIFVTIFSVKPILKLLKKVDLINVIEGV